MATSPFKFLQEVREETRKVTWPSRKETMITTVMVFIMVAIASIFFLWSRIKSSVLPSPSCSALEASAASSALKTNGEMR